MNKRILILSDDPLMPVNSGGRMRTWNLIKALAATYRVDILCPAAEHFLPNADKRYFYKIWHVEHHTFRKQISLTFTERLSNIFRMVPWEISYHYRAAFEEKFREVIHDNAYDYILARYIHQAQYIFRALPEIKSKIIIDLDDIEIRKKERQIGVANGNSAYNAFRRKLNNFILEKYHEKNLKFAHCCLVCSEEDKAFILNKRWCPKVAVVPNILEMDDSMISEYPANGKTILFLGTLNYYPNEEGILWFTKKVFPFIQAVEKDVKLNIVGRKPKQVVLDLQDGKNIFICPDVQDVRSFYENATLSIAPIRIAGGTRIKILESALYKRPVVATTIGAEGLGLVNRTHCLIEDEKEAFARGCLDLLHDTALARQLSEANYNFVRSHYGMEAMSKGLEKALANQNPSKRRGSNRD